MIENLSILPSLVFFDAPLKTRMFIIFIFLLLALQFRFGGKTHNIKQSKYIGIILLTIWILNILQQINIPLTFLSLILAYTNLILFAFYLSNCFSYYKRIYSSSAIAFRILLSPYIFYAIYNVSVIILSAILLGTKVISVSNLYEFSLGADNINTGAEYLFPAYLSIINNASRLSFLSGLPLFLGLSHEPHVLCFLIFPSLFFILSDNTVKRETKFIIIIMYISVLLLSISTTAALVLMIVFLVHLLYNFFIRKRGGRLLLFITALLIALSPIIRMIYEEIIQLKVTTERGSLDYSMDVFKYILTPNAIFGYGTVATPKEIIEGKYQIGLLSFILIIFFYIHFIFNVLRFVFSKNLMIHYIGLGLLYMALHMFKIAILIISYPYLIFMLIIPYGYCLENLHINSPALNLSREKQRSLG